MTFEDFCRAYIGEARKAAEETVAKHIAKTGKLPRTFDVELVKELGITYGLEKTFLKYDPASATNGMLPFLHTVVRNCVKTELVKEGKSLNLKNRDDMESLVENRKEYRFTTSIGSDAYHDRKEQVIKQLVGCVKKLSPMDQVIIYCWLDDRKNYIEMALAELGLKDTPKTQNTISVHLNRAKKLLAQMMGGKKPQYRDAYLPAPSARNAYGSDYVPVDRNTARRRERVATAYITRNIDYQVLGDGLYGMIVSSK